MLFDMAVLEDDTILKSTSRERFLPTKSLLSDRQENCKRCLKLRSYLWNEQRTTHILNLPFLCTYTEDDLITFT